MSATVCIQDKYMCYKCKSASDIYGRSCKHGMLFPIGLLMANMSECPNFELDIEKVKESLDRKEVSNGMGSEE